MTLHDQIFDLLNSRGAVRHVDIIDHFAADPSEIIMEALSELTMDNKIKRIEYVLPGSFTRRAIYFPIGTRIE